MIFEMSYFLFLFLLRWIRAKIEVSCTVTFRLHFSSLNSLSYLIVLTFKSSLNFVLICCKFYLLSLYNLFNFFDVALFRIKEDTDLKLAFDDISQLFISFTQYLVRSIMITS